MSLATHSRGPRRPARGQARHRRRRRGPRERGRRDHGRRVRDPGVDRVDGAPHERLPLRADAERGRRPARAAAHDRAQRGRRAAPPTRSRSTPPTAPRRASAPPTARTRCACSPTRPRRPIGCIRPGHVLPLRAVDGGVRERAGHTEAAVDLMRLAGLSPVGVIGEIVADDGEMMRLPGAHRARRARGPAGHDRRRARRVAARVAPVTTSSADAATATVPESSPVAFEVETTLPTEHGEFTRARLPRPQHRRRPRRHHRRRPGERTPPAPIVRVHSECLTGEAFGSLKCECGPQLDAALETIQRPTAASSSTCAATRAAASGSSTSCAPTACRRTASTRSTRTSRSACRSTPATTARRPRSSPTSASTACACSRTTPRRCASSRRTASASSSGCRSWSASAPSTTATSTPSVDRMGHAIDDQQLDGCRG